ncbi:dihydrodipicolinate synthase domain protein [Mycobacterium xenopi 4042]|uniref:Dihydrodipicolinate synthase domain protein n=1 Tax=Mycobacterium xenopi 4042 TaxID=1299334 RepID=X8CGQ3_MYCXE|nr:dihydrodipicolinate synthase domain protein [Mycobacterium xenopi 4042]
MTMAKAGLRLQGIDVGDPGCLRCPRPRSRRTNWPPTCARLRCCGRRQVSRR